MANYVVLTYGQFRNYIGIVGRKQDGGTHTEMEADYKYNWTVS